MSTRGCPYACEFCSNVVFGASYRARSPGSVVDEVEQALALGYDRISFADDVFTLERERVLAICDEIGRRGAPLLLGVPRPRRQLRRRAMAAAMRAAGCFRVFFGIESGVDARAAADEQEDDGRRGAGGRGDRPPAGLEAGAFFILCYPGETDDTVLDTLRFATSLPLDYVGLTMPYPLPGTALLARVGDLVTARGGRRRACCSTTS